MAVGGKWWAIGAAFAAALVSACGKPEPAAPAPQPHAPAAAREGRVTVDKSGKFVPYHVGDRNVKALYLDGRIVWVGTTDGVIRYDSGDDSYRLFDTGNGLPAPGAFYVGKLNGRIAVGTYGGGLAVLQDDGASWKDYNRSYGLGDPFVFDVLTAKNGDVWIATWSGVNRVRGGALDDPSRWELFTVKSTKGGLPDDWVYGLAEGRGGEIWLATEGGVARFDRGRWAHWNHGDGLGAPYEKIKGDIAFRGDPAKESGHHAEQMKAAGLGNVSAAYNPNYVVALAADDAGQVWAGTWGGGLSRFDGKKWTTWTTAEGLPGNHVFMLHKDVQGRLWVGTNKGLSRWRNGAFERVNPDDGVPEDSVFSMADAPGGGIWVGGYGRMVFLRP